MGKKGFNFSSGGGLNLSNPIKSNTGSYNNPIANALAIANGRNALNDQEDQIKLKALKDAGGFTTGATVSGESVDMPQTGKPAPPEMQDKLTEGVSTAKDLISNANQLMDNPNIQNQMGPQHPSAYMNGMGNLAMNMRSAINRYMGKSNKDVTDFAEFKSSTGDIFQRYRKFLDGVRAAVGGSKLETPIFPQTSSDPDIFISQTLGLLKNMETNYHAVANTIQGQGYRTGGISDIFPSQGAQDLRSKRDAGQKMSLEDELRQMYMPGKK